MSTTLLHVDASPRGERSVTRTLSHEFVRQFRDAEPATRVVYRDLNQGAAPVPFVTETWIAAAFSPPGQWDAGRNDEAVRTSDLLIEEFLAADLFVFGVPMYNFNVPAVFKAYLDLLARVGRTFTFGPQGPEGLVKGRPAVFVTARGSDYTTGSPLAALDLQAPYLRAIFEFMGFRDLYFLHGNGLNDFLPTRDATLQRLRAEIPSLVVQAAAARSAAQVGTGVLA